MATSSVSVRRAEDQSRPRARARFRPGRLLVHLGLIVAGFFYLFPFLWMLSGSLKSLNGFFTQGLSLIPDAWRWQNYSEAWTVEFIPIYP
jgi:raffinose/stachyose/melibiose transport system permease protein